MINYWWVTRPKRKLNSIPEVLAVFAGVSLNQRWNGSRNIQRSYEDALEQAGLKRVGLRRDQSGSGGRTYAAWLSSLGLIFSQESTGYIYLTLAGEAIIDGASPVDVLKAQVLKYQFPSAFSIGRSVNVNRRFKVHPFRFLLRLLMDDRIEYLTQDEIAKVCIVDAENESERCYETVVEKILDYREYGDAALDKNFFEKYGPSKGTVNSDHPYSHLQDCANTFINWIEYTQLAVRDDHGWLKVPEGKYDEVRTILAANSSFVDRPEDQEYFQRKYGLDPKHQKDTRNLEQTKTITAEMIDTMKVQNAYIRLSLNTPITQITTDLINEIAGMVNVSIDQVSDVLMKTYPHGSVGSFLTHYYEMSIAGTKYAVEFEKATTDLFDKVFHYNAIHLGQTGSKSAPDILLISDDAKYQAVIDNKAYREYSIIGDHHNRMVHNYLEKINTYSNCAYPIGFFAYVAGGFGKTIDKQIDSEVVESGVPGAGITASNFIKLVDNQTSGVKNYTHQDLLRIFGCDRQIRMSDF